MLGNATQPVGQRLASLDILRGFDLFLLVFLQPVLVSLGACVDSSVMNAVLYAIAKERKFCYVKLFKKKVVLDFNGCVINI